MACFFSCMRFLNGFRIFKFVFFVHMFSQAMLELVRFATDIASKTSINISMLVPDMPSQVASVHKLHITNMTGQCLFQVREIHVIVDMIPFEEGFSTQQGTFDFQAFVSDLFMLIQT